MHPRIFNIDATPLDILEVARTAQRKLRVEGTDAPRSLDEAIANFEAVTTRIIEKQRAFEDAQRRLEQQLAAVAGDVEQRWQAIEQQLSAVVTRLCRYD